MERHSQNGEKIAHYLKAHPAVKKVYWPGFEDHPGHAIAKAQMKSFGGMISFVPGVPHAIDEPVGALPSLIYIWENASERAFHERTAAAIIVLLVFMIIMNAAAIILRRRFERRW